jgi:hypothetical protein
MTISGGIYFLGRYRPAYFEAGAIGACVTKMQAALRNVEDHALRAWLYARIDEGLTHMVTSNTTAWSADHCDRGVSFAKRPHDRFLDRVTADMEPCPGLDYSGACNATDAADESEAYPGQNAWKREGL